MKNSLNSTLWKVYFIIFVLSLFLTEVYLKLYSGFKLHEYLDLPLSVLALVGLFGLAFGKKILSANFWKIYFFVYLVWDTSFLFINPYISSSKFNFTTSLFAFIVMLPLYVGLYFYGFKFDGDTKNNKKSVTEIVIRIILIIAIIIGGLVFISGVFVLFDKNKKDGLYSSSVSECKNNYNLLPDDNLNNDDMHQYNLEKNYQNSQLNFSINYPNNWKYTEKDVSDYKYLLFGPNTGDISSVIYITVPNNKTENTTCEKMMALVDEIKKNKKPNEKLPDASDKYKNTVINSFLNEKRFSQTINNGTTISGISIEREYFETGYNAKDKIFIFPQNDRFVIITYTSKVDKYDENYSVVLQMLNSLKTIK
jgi:hypothetical protein